MHDWKKLLDNTITDIKNTMIQTKEWRNSAILKILTNLHLEIHNETRWSSKCKILQKCVHIRSRLIETSSHQYSNIDINNSTASKHRVTKFTRWIKDTDVIIIYMFFLNMVKDPFFLYSSNFDSNPLFLTLILILHTVVTYDRSVTLSDLIAHTRQRQTAAYDFSFSHKKNPKYT